jgi:hypothetical protein
VPDREPVTPRAGLRGPCDLGAQVARAGGPRRLGRPRGRRRRGQPAGARARGGRCEHPDLCAPRHRAPRRPDRAAAGRRLLVKRQQRDPRRRQQVGGRDRAAARPPADLSPGAAPGRARAAVHGLRGGVAARLACVRHLAAAQRVRLRVRPRHTDRRGGARLADALPDRRRVPRPGRPRRRAARDGSQRNRGCREGDRGDAARAAGRADDRQCRHDRRWHGDQRDPRALPDRGRGAKPRRCARGRGYDADRRSPRGRSQRHRVRPRSRCRADVQRLPDQALGAAGAGRRARAPGGASDANSFRAAGFGCTCLADGVEHNHEPTERVSAQALETMFEIAIALVDEAAVELGVAT